MNSIKNFETHYMNIFAMQIFFDRYEYKSSSSIFYYLNDLNVCDHL